MPKKSKAEIKKIFDASRKCRDEVGAKPFKKMTPSQKKKFNVCYARKIKKKK